MNDNIKNRKDSNSNSIRPTVSYQGSSKEPVGKIGPYKLLNILGEGGFSIVYLAEQDRPVKRLVALKVIKPGMDTKQVIARFEAERQTLALLNHPNIAAVYDAGATETGLPYFVMENVKGEPITQHCDRHKLRIEERLELFLQVCDAVQHAHQKGIIHRDIKPSNILVSVDGEKAAPRIIDFGISRAITRSLSERTLYTEQGQFVGTPEYMSPEQAEMGAQDIDTRSDIYSLGVVLYELLAGTLPFDPDTLREGSIEQIRQIIRQQEPKRPSTRLTSMGEDAGKIAENRNIDLGNLRRRLNRELEWIPLKAMRKDRTRRYRSASEFADDIRNYLNGRPLIAGPESTAYRLKKMVQRNRTLITGISAVLIVLIAGIIGTTNFAIRASKAQKEAEAARLESDHQAKAAQLISDFLREDLLESMDPYVNKNADVRTVLDNASSKLEGKFNDPLVEAMIRYSLGKIYRNLGTITALDRAEKHLLEANRIQQEILGSKNKNTLNTMEALASVYMRMGFYESAEIFYNKTIEGRAEILGGNAPETLSAMNELGIAYLSWGKYKQAGELYEKLLDISKKEFGEDGVFTLFVTGNLATVYRFQGHYEQSEQLYLKVQENMGVLFDNDDPDALYYVLYTLNGMGMLYIANENYQDAKYLFEDALRIATSVLGEGHPDTLSSKNGLGLVHIALEDYETAENDYLRPALETERLELGSDNPVTLTTLHYLGWLELNRGIYQEEIGNAEQAQTYYKNAEEYLIEAYSGRQRILGLEHPATLESENGLAILYEAMGRYQEAVQYFQDTIKKRKLILGSDHPFTISSEEQLQELVDMGYAELNPQVEEHD